MKSCLPAILMVAVLGSCNREPKPAEAKPTPPTAAVDPHQPQAYLGMAEKEASDLAEKSGIKWRVVEVDGQSRPVTMDYQPDRLNFAIKDGKVIRVTQG